MITLWKYFITAGVLVAASGCADATKSGPSAVPSSSASGSSSASQGASASFGAIPENGTAVSVTFGSDARALTYNPALVPKGAGVQVVESSENGTTKVALRVRGLVANRQYGAHVHSLPCGPTGEAAGPHFQHNPDPAKPSVNPAFANPKNEIWLDFTTDASGNASVSSTVPWTFTNTRAGSVIIHAERTQTAAGKAGTAGARLACVGVPF
jgi:superoxide dismutase, Cu-Zn family